MDVRLCTDIGTKATFFGLGLLASKKMRPYAKYFIIGGMALSAAPAIMQLVEKAQEKKCRPKEQVEEVVIECEETCHCAETEPCCQEEEACEQAEAQDCQCAEECAEEADVECDEQAEEAPCEEEPQG
ncbi:MAG: hypothetical protein GX060_06220 [Firmicutes bacterium]|nr:hypothetical protein [Bacillota bacterium]